MARRPKRLPALLITLVLLIGGVSAGPPSVAQAACHPILTTPEFAGVIPTAHEVLGFDLGDHEVSAV